ncbi:MAG: Rho termination factor N-terminal domain-containing protein, partial [Pseudomonadota bacterium]|nr:Rho termination factor N-terminal domain-containing protein [Pseudomonadota bacterium]
MDLAELQEKKAEELIDMAKELGIENAARTRKQDIIFLISKKLAKPGPDQQGADIHGSGVLDVLQDGFGFLRTPANSYLPGPDDIYVSPSQIRKYNLRVGDSIAGK